MNQDLAPESWELMLLCEQLISMENRLAQLEEHHRTPLDRIDFDNAVTLINGSPNPFRGLMRHSLFTLECLPQGLAAALLAGNVRCHDAICEAVRRYLRVWRHARALDAYIEDEVRKEDRHAARLQTERSFLRGEISSHKQQLALLQVTISEVPPGTAFDPRYHRCDPEQAAETTVNPSEVDTVAFATTPLFTWCDHQGQQQCVPANVVLYELAGETDA